MAADRRIIVLLKETRSMPRPIREEPDAIADELTKLPGKVNLRHAPPAMIR
jgi:hypothetical protein